MSAKPTELKRLMALLDTEADDITAFSKAVWNLVEDLLNERERYVVLPSTQALIWFRQLGLMTQKQKRLPIIKNVSTLMIRNRRLVWHSCDILIQLRNKINGELLVLSPRYVAP